MKISAVLQVVVDWLGRKAVMLLVTLAALVLVGLADREAAAEIGWCIVASYGVFAGANSTITALANRAAPVKLPKEPKEPPAGE